MHPYHGVCVRLCVCACIYVHMYAYVCVFSCVVVAVETYLSMNDLSALLPTFLKQVNLPASFVCVFLFFSLVDELRCSSSLYPGNELLLFMGMAPLQDIKSLPELLALTEADLKKIDTIPEEDRKKLLALAERWSCEFLVVGLKVCLEAPMERGPAACSIRDVGSKV